MALIKGDKVYRNLQEQVYENTCDIQELLRMYGYHGPYTSTDVIPADDLYNRAMYLIGTGMPYKVYQYNDLTKRFTYIGDYNMDVGPEGPPGPQGPQGERGPDGKPASEIVNIETYDVVYKKDVTESKVRANFDDGHSNEFSVYAKNGEINDNNLIAGKGITVDYNYEDRTATIGVNNTIVDTDKLNEELSKKQDKLTPGEHISIVDNVISAIGVSGNVLSGNGITVENTADDKVIVNISNDVIDKINEIDNKQDIIEDLDTIRNGAAKGATAVQPAELEGYIPVDTFTDNINSINAAIGGLSTSINATNVRVDAVELNMNLIKDNAADIANDLSNHTSNDTIHVTAEDKAEWSNKVSQSQIADMATKTELGNYVTTDTLNTTVSSIDNKLTTKQDVIDDLETIRSGASAGATAVQPATLEDYATKAEIPDVSIYATTDSVNAAVSDLNNAVNTEVAARKSEITRVENKIPTQYLYSASVVGNLLSIISSDGSQIQYNPTDESQMDPYVQCEYKNGQLIFTCNSLYGEKYLPIGAKIYINDNAAVIWDAEATKTIDLDMTAKG